MSAFLSSTLQYAFSPLYKIFVRDGRISGLSDETDGISACETKATLRPTHIYGTAWKGDDTSSLVFEAISAGYRAIDTAAQPRHHRENLAGEGIRRAVDAGLICREDIYIQTKFSHGGLQDKETSPFAHGVPIRDQVRASITSSLHNFRLSPDSDPYLDTVLLHSFLPTGAETLEAWRALEEYVPHTIRRLGLSNVSLEQVQALSRLVCVKPCVVQSRFYAETGFDGQLRRFCEREGIEYQAYWVLKKNARLLRGAAVVELAERAGVSGEVALFGLLHGLNGGNTVAVMDGTTRKERMYANVDGLAKVTKWMNEEANGAVWREFQRDFGFLLETGLET